MEVVPQHASRILDDSDVGSHISFIVLDKWDVLALEGIGEEAFEVIESGKAPVRFFGVEAVRCDYRSKSVDCFGPQ